MHILLTGASRGIGRGFAETVLEQGASLSVCARTPHSLDTLAAKGAHAQVLDVTDATAVQRWVTAAVAQHGPIDAVVNNAALLGPKATVADYSIDAWRQVMDVNVDGPFLVTKAAIPHLRLPGARLVVFTSYLGRHAIERFGAYCASKYAVEGLARLLHEELHDRGAISIAVDPGRVQSEMLKAAAETDDVSEHNTSKAAGAALWQLVQDLNREDSGKTHALFGQEL